ncbi:MAG: TIM barrel protein [Dehalococcoidia bacterium]|nr:TIM barrel protein [Dehalococcoidia bacterium]
MARLLFGTAGIPLSSRSNSTQAGVERVHELGLGCMEVEFVQGVTLNPESARIVQKVAASRGIRLSAHAPYWINLNSQEPRKVAASRQYILRAALITSILGGDGVVFHPAFYMKDSPAAVYIRVKENLLRIIQELRIEGNNVRIRPEVTGKPVQFGTLEEVLQLSAEVEGVAPAIDFAHLYARTGKVNSYGEFVAVLERTAEALGSEALADLHMHVSGIEYSPRGERRHLPLEESDFRFEELLRALKDLDAGGLLICESPTNEADALLLQETYEAL